MTMKRLTIVVLAVAMLAGAALPATAQTAEDLSELRDGAQEAIDVRLGSIADARGEVRAAEHIAAPHASELLGDLDTAEANLTGLSTEVHAATSAWELWRILGRVFAETRVYAVLMPTVIGVSVADAAEVVAGELDAAAGEVQAAIDAADAWGADVSTAQATLDAAVAGIGDARAFAGSVPDRLLALVPGDYPAMSPGAIDQSVGDLRGAFEALKDAGRDIVDALEALGEALRG
jgi:hypothetical protein